MPGRSRGHFATVQPITYHEVRDSFPRHHFLGKERHSRCLYWVQLFLRLRCTFSMTMVCWHCLPWCYYKTLVCQPVCPGRCWFFLPVSWFPLAQWHCMKRR